MIVSKEARKKNNHTFIIVNYNSVQSPKSTSSFKVTKFIKEEIVLYFLVDNLQLNQESKLTVPEKGRSSCDKVDQTAFERKRNLEWLLPSAKCQTLMKRT